MLRKKVTVESVQKGQADGAETHCFRVGTVGTGCALLKSMNATHTGRKAMYKITVDPSTWQGNKRIPRESFENYKVRRAAENRCTKIYLKGVFCWKSVVFGKVKDEDGNEELRRIGGRGTYVSPKKTA